MLTCFPRPEFTLIINRIVDIVPTALNQPPKPVRGSRQRVGESVWAFMSRTQRENKEREQKEDPEAREARLQRIAHHATFPLPGDKGARVWEWELHGAYWLRTPIFRGEVQEYWKDYDPRNLLYDPHHKEWDMCEEFNFEHASEPLCPPPPVGGDPYSQYEEDEQDDMGTIVETSWEDLHLSSLRQIDEDPYSQFDGGEQDFPNVGADDTHEPLVIRTAALQQSYWTKTSARPRLDFEKLDDILRLRYGFTNPGLLEDPQDIPQGRALRWDEVRMTLGDNETEWTGDDTLKQTISTFVRSVLANHVSAELWDLDPANPEAVSNTGRYVSIISVHQHEKTWYRILLPSSSEKGEWDLIVDDTITALECVRGGSLGATNQDLASYLMQTGRSFRALFKMAPVISPSDIEPDLPNTSPTDEQERPTQRGYSNTGLGWRHAGFKPSPLDLAAYEAKRAGFLKSDRGRVALQMGGIVWRLALEVISPGTVFLDYDMAVSSGCMDGESQENWEARLTADELEIVCGVYKVFMCEFYCNAVIGQS